MKEETVAKAFKEDDAEITCVFEETGKTLVIDLHTDTEIIKKYLGSKFIKR